MSQIQKNEKQILIKGSSVFLYIVIGAVFMAFIGGALLFSLLPFAAEYGIVDIIGVIFVCIWLSVVFWMGWNSLVHYSQKIIIDETGVVCSAILKQKRYEWSEIKDYGLSYTGQVRGEGNAYDLYFAKDNQKQRNECRKKLKGDFIKIIIYGTDDYHIIAKTVIPFCEQYTSAEPFIGVDKYHFF